MKDSKPTCTGGPPLGAVLVATDFSPHADDATIRAAWLPLRLGASITLLHVLPQLPDAQMGDVRAAAEALLRTAVGRLGDARERRRLPRVELYSTIVVGAPAECVAQRARDEQAELILVGRGGEPGPRERLLGSTAERIVRASDRNVLVVAAPPQADYCRPLVAVDLSPLSRQAVDALLRLATHPVIEVVLAHSLPSSFPFDRVTIPSEKLQGWAANETERAQHQLGRWIADNADLGVKLHPRVRRGEVAATIIAEAKAHATDLLVVGTRGHSTLVHLALGAVAERVLRRAPCDVLAVRAS